MASLELTSVGNESAMSTPTLVWDNHACMPMRADDTFLPELERCQRAGFTVVSINVGFADMTWSDHLKILTFIRGWVAQRPKSYRLVSSVDDVDRCLADGKLGIVFDVEGMVPVQDDASRIETLYQMGVRWMLIAYNRNNKAGGGCMDDDCGLTDIGRAVISEMNRVGMVLCLSHTGRQTAIEAIEYSASPTIFSHSNPNSVHHHVRNVHDDIIKQCAAKGGVIGISGIGLFLGASTDLLTAWVDQVEYVLDLVGPNHVGIGLDYVFDTGELRQHIKSNPSLYPQTFGNLEMLAPECLPALIEAMLRRGVSESDLRKLLGLNWRRIAQQVWRGTSEPHAALGISDGV